ncbi:hypothetical protein Cgig2_026828 [Carnegiea gigantea]|uniref:Vesicle transport protein GOT1A n=1 Tax=Carnegiea gigantea TaxID=171969 RepID=A0A9Q1QR32_9CARY|nr:hypothetical protein Cgig2_026828 [Carnegiea gigantea]
MVSFEMNDMKKIGLGLTGFGVFFTFLGVVFLFDKGLLAMGNILFLSGLALTIGLKSTLQFFMKPKNYKGTISFALGFFFVIIGWAILGMILESYASVDDAPKSLPIIGSSNNSCWLPFAVAFGLRWRFFCRRYQFLVGSYSNHSLDRKGSVESVSPGSNGDMLHIIRARLAHQIDFSDLILPWSFELIKEVIRHTIKVAINEVKILIVAF